LGASFSSTVSNDGSVGSIHGEVTGGICDFVGIEEEVKKRSPAPSVTSFGGKSVQWSDWMTCFSTDGTFEFQKEGSPIAKEVELVQPEEVDEPVYYASSECSSFDYDIREPWDDVDLLYV